LNPIGWLLYGACFASVLFAVFSFWEAVRVRRRWNAHQLAIQPLLREEGRARRGMLRRLRSWLNQTEYIRNVEARLREANLKLTAGQWIIAGISGWMALCLFLDKLFGLAFPYNGLLAYPLCKLASAQWRKSRASKLSQAVGKQLAEVCRLLASAVKAGLSLQQGLELVAAEIKPPAGRLFQGIVSELKVGNGLDVVLGRLSMQVKSKELSLFTNAILIHRRVGANLAEVLEHLALTLEERQRIQKEVAHYSSEPRFIALLLTGMPIVIIALFNLALDGFGKLLFTPPGMVLIAVSALLIACGLALIRKIANVKV